MDVYILDRENNRTDLIDQYESFIWTDRYSAFGDFQMKIPSTYASRSILTEGRKVQIDQSDRVQTIEVVEDSVDDSGRNMLTVKGRSLEIAVLDNRIARIGLVSLELHPKWILKGKPADVAREMYYEICVVGELNEGDIFSDVVPAIPPILNRIPEPQESLTFEIEPKTLYGAIKEVCDGYDLGFRIVRTPDSNQFEFHVYTGYDRTTAQTANSPVIFAPELDNLQDTTAFSSIADAKNVAYVLGRNASRLVYGAGIDPTISGFDRKILLVKADDHDPDMVGQELYDFLGQRGVEELSHYRNVKAFDGEIQMNSRYIYGRDYGLGDIVEVKNVDGATNNMMVTEQIFAADAEGVRSYPTLTLHSYVYAGIWSTWNKNQDWNDLTTEIWKDLP